MSIDLPALARALRAEIAKAVVGQDALTDMMLIALLSRGHILLEGPPGTAKTLLAQSFAAASALEFGRIQFTPDLMPGDILGSNLFNFQTSTFHLTKGPIFTHYLLADEINRTPPKTQAALLQAMQERVVTIDGVSHALSPHFTVVATQNPIEQQGVYPLPEAQLDRFLFKLSVGYPAAEDEKAIILQHSASSGARRPQDFGINPVLDAAKIDAAIAVIDNVTLADDVAGYIVTLAHATRQDPELDSGISARAATMLARAAATRAALEGRDFVLPDDVQALAPSVMRHRLILSPTAEIEGRTADQIVGAIIERTPVPR